MSEHSLNKFTSKLGFILSLLFAAALGLLFVWTSPVSAQTENACNNLLAMTPDESHPRKELAARCVKDLPKLNAKAQTKAVVEYLKGARRFIPEESLEPLAGRLQQNNARRLRAVHVWLQAKAEADETEATPGRLMSQAKAAKDQLSQVYIHLARAEYAKTSKDTAKVNLNLREAERLARANKMAGLQNEVLAAQAKYATDNQQYDLGYRLNRQAVLGFVANGDFYGASGPCLNLAIALESNPEITIADINKLIGQAKDNEILQVCLNRGAGIRAFDKGQGDNVEKYMKRALDLAQANGFAPVRGMLLNTFALGAYERGEYDVAVERYEESIKLFEADGKIGDVGIIYANIAMIFSDLGDNDRAIEFLEKALEIYREIPDGDYYIPTAIGNIAQAHGIEGRHDVAVELFQQAVTLNNDQPNRKLDGFLSFQYAKSLYELGENQRAIDLANLAVKQILEYREPAEAATALVWLSKQYLKQNDLKAAEDALERARVIIDPENRGPENLGPASGNSYWNLEYSKNMAKLLAALGRPEEALRFSQVALRLSDERFETDKLKALANFDILLKLRERDRDMETLQQEALVKDLSLSEARLRGWLGLAGAVLAALVALLLFRSNRAQKKLVHAKDVFLAEIHHRTKNNLQLLISLLNLDTRKQKKHGIQEAGSEDAANRARTMALVHDHIYNSAKSTEIDAKNFLDDLLTLLEESLGRDNIELKGDISPVEIDIDKFTTLGLLVCELVTNAYKHAFAGQVKSKANGRTIKVSLKPEKDNFSLLVADNGEGFDKEAGSAREDSMGMMLIEDLADQLDGDFDLQSRPEGTIWKITASTVTSSPLDALA